MEKNKKSIWKLLILGVAWFLIIASIVLSIILWSIADQFEWLLLLPILLILICLCIIFYNKKLRMAFVNGILILALIFSSLIIYFNKIFIISSFLIICIFIFLYRKQLLLFCKKIKMTIIKKENKRLCFVLIVIFIVFAFAFYTWLRFYINYRGFYYMIEDSVPGITQKDVNSVNMIWSIKLKEIVIFAGLMFTSAFLVLRATKKD